MLIASLTRSSSDRFLLAMKSTTSARTTVASTQTTCKPSPFRTTAGEAPRRPTLGELNGETKVLLTVSYSVSRAWSEATLRKMGGRQPHEGVKLTDVYTTPSLRGQGYGRRVVGSLLAHAADQGWPVFLYVKPYGWGQGKLTRQGLAQFYRSLGFCDVGLDQMVDSLVMIYDPLSKREPGKGPRQEAGSGPARGAQPAAQPEQGHRLA